VSLGKKIADLSQDQFEAMPLGDDLRQAFIVARKLSKGGAIKRQFKYIGKLLRSTDVTLINESMERQLDKDRAAAARLHNMERWRDKLVEQGDVALSDFLVSFPNADRQHIRQLQRKAKLELEKEKPPAAARKIFQYIKELSITD
jgi:ribosome-associated protein